MNQHYFDVPFAFSGDVTAIPDPLQTGGTVSFTEGWNYNYQRNLATDPAALPIDRSTMNWLLLQITTAIQALQQTGCPEFITSTQNGGTAFSYGKGSRVLWSASGSAPFTKFVNLNAGNTNTPSLSDPTGATTGWQIDVDPISTSAQAAAGTDNASIMTPLLVAQQTALRALLAGSATQVFNVGPATSATHAPEASQVQQNAFNYAGLAGGTANALTATLTPAPTSYTDYLTVIVRVAANNTSSTSINVNGLGAKPVIGAAHQVLQGGELIAGGFACFAYSTNYSEAILLWATGGAEQVGNATQSHQAVSLGQLAAGTTNIGNLAQFTTSGSFTVPANVTTLWCSGCGGGGGGGGSGSIIGVTSYASTSGGGGGAQGQWARKVPITVTPGQVLTIAIGAGGAHGIGGSGGSGGANGSTGGNTTITGTGVNVTLTGGAGGAGSNGVTANYTVSTPGRGGGPGASDGGWGLAVVSYGFDFGGAGGAGGNTPFGVSGGTISYGVGVMRAGVGYGAGGSGAVGVTTNSSTNGINGVDGLPGYLEFEW